MYWYDIYLVDENSYYVHYFRKTKMAADIANDFYMGKRNGRWQYEPVPMLNPRYSSVNAHFQRFIEAHLSDDTLKELGTAIDDHLFEKKWRDSKTER